MKKVPIRKVVSMETPVIPNMPGRNRPKLNCDGLGYPVSVGDHEWETKLKKLYKKVDGGWVRKSS